MSARDFSQVAPSSVASNKQLIVSFGDSIGGIRRILVLPDANDPPPEIAEPVVGVIVPFHILPDLLPPPSDIGFRFRSMDRTIVPETSINENRKTCAGEDDVHCARAAGNHSTLDSVAKPPIVQGGSNTALNVIVHPPGRSHSAAGLG